MKIETYIVYLTDRNEAERLEGTVHNDLKELKQLMAVDGVVYGDILLMSDFMSDWNNKTGITTHLANDFITYVYIVE